MGDDLNTSKSALRSALLARRRALTPSEVASLSLAAQERLLALDVFSAARTVHCYVGVKANEVRTDRVLEETLASGRRLVVPCVVGDVLEHREVRAVAELRPSAFGLLEPPPDAPRVAPNEVDLVVVPGLAFDSSGNRLGLGRGYYDRFLAGIAAVKAALLYEFQIVGSVPAEASDVPVDLLVTDTRVLQVRRPA